MFCSKKTIYFSVILGLFCAVMVFSMIIPAQSVSAPKTANTPLSQSDTISANVYVTSLTRTYQINENGLVIINDQYIFTNNGSSTVGVLQVGLTDTEYDHLVYYSAQNDLLGTLAIHIAPVKENGYSILEIILDQPLQAFASQTVNVETVFKNMVNYTVGDIATGSDTNQYLLTAQIIPLIPYFISNSTSNFVLPTGAAQITLSPTGNETGNTQGFTFGNTPAYQNASTVVSYRDQSDSLLEFTQVNRIFRINPLGYITVDEFITLTNNAYVSATTYSFTIPSDAQNVVANDNPLNNILGLTVSSTPNIDGSTNVTFAFGNANANRPALNYQNQITFELIYSLPFNHYITNNLGTYSLMIDLFATKTNFIADNETVQVQIMDAYDVHDLSFCF